MNEQEYPVPALGQIGRWVGHSGFWTAHSHLHIVRVIRFRRSSGPWVLQVWSKWLPTGQDRVILNYWEAVHQEDCDTFGAAERAALAWLAVKEAE